MSILENSTTIVQSVEGMFQVMKDIEALCISAGLTVVDSPDRFDVNGDSSQIPTLVDTSSAPLLYSFSDEYQQNSPVNISIQASYGKYGNTYTSSNTHFITVSASNGGIYTSSARFGGGSSPGTALIFRVGFSSNLGNFINYRGDSLTFLFGVNSLKRTFHTTYDCNRNMIFLHIERCRDRNDNITNGIALLMDTKQPTGNVSVTNYNETGFVRTLIGSNLIDGRSGGYSRILGTDGYFDGGSAIVSPIYYQNNGSWIPMKYAFTIASNTISNAFKYNLDFTGVEKSYLAQAPHFCFPLYDSAAWLFEWENTYGG